jgi:hypothetical protein
MSEINEGLLAVLAGRETFDELVKRTRGYWRRLAGSIFRRWRQPMWVSPEDVEQDLLMWAWKFVWDFDPKRGTSIEKFVEYNAYDKAKKLAHRARKAKLHGNPDGEQGRFERNFSSMYSSAEADEADRRVEVLSRVEPQQQEYVDARQTFERVLAKCRTPTEVHFVREAALAGVFDDALALDEDALVQCALRMYERKSIVCGLGSEDEALRAAVQAAHDLAHRIAKAA